MGGNALKHSNTKRVGRAEHARVGEQVLAKLGQRFPGHRLEIIPAYAQKTEFGNVSVFFQSDVHRAKKELSDELKVLFDSAQAVRHDNRISVAVDGLQVDISVISSAHFQLALDYHSFNMLGGLIGQLANAVGLTLRDTGMVLRVINGSHLSTEIPVASTWSEILDILGLSYHRWCKGFATLSEMFAFVTTSPVFQKDLFQDSSYQDIPAGQPLRITQKFGLWLDTVSARELPTLEPVTKEAWLARLMALRPDVKAPYDAAIQFGIDRAAASQKLNGNVVRNLTGLDNEALGKFMKALRDSFGSESAQVAWVLTASNKDIVSKITTLRKAL